MGTDFAESEKSSFEHPFLAGSLEVAPDHFSGCGLAARVRFQPGRVTPETLTHSDHLLRVGRREIK